MSDYITCPHCSSRITLMPGQRFCSICKQPLIAAAATPTAAPSYSWTNLNPYESNESRAATPIARGFNSGHTLAIWTVGLLGIAAFLCVIATMSDVWELSLLERIANGGSMGAAEASGNDARQRLIGIAQIGVNLVMLVPLFMWIYRVNKNLRALGAADLKFTPGWAVGWFFVPFANFVKPYQAMKEIWQASSPFNGGDELAWKEAPVSPLLSFWWATWVINALIARVIDRFFWNQDSLESYIQQDWVAIFTNVVNFTGYILLITIILEVDRRQEYKSWAPVIAPAADEPLYALRS